MKLVRQEVDGAILSTSQQAHVNLWLVMFLGMHLESASKQWGYVAGTGVAITFPLKYSSKAFAVVVSPNTTSGSSTASQATGLSLTGFTITVHGNNGWWISSGI